jgi:hypothetical protein
MSSEAQNNPAPSFGHFLEYLRLNQFAVGVEHYSRVQYVLDRIGEDYRPGDPESQRYVKASLSPLFATSEEEQHTFSQLFDDYLEHCQRAFHNRKDARGGGTSVEQWVFDAGAGTAGGGRQRAARGALREWRRLVRRRLGRNGIAALALAFAAFAVVICMIVTRQPTGEVIPGPQVAPSTVPAPSPVQTSSPAQTPPTEPALPTESEPPPLFYLLLAVALLTLLLLFALLRRWLRRFDPRNYENKRPPFRWPLRVPAPAVSLYDSDEFREAARLMRRRQIDEFFRLDIEATVSATTRSLGYPSFRYKPATRVPEYLILIEWESTHDHQARLLDEMVKALKNANVIATRYFYGDDPLVCCDENNANCVPLEELKQRHAGHHLLLFGSCGQLLDPLTGKLSERSAAFYDWHSRAVVTPESDWGWREHILSEKFVIVRADARGLLTLSDQLESSAAGGLNWRPPTDPHPMPHMDEETGTIEALSSYLGPDLFQWLCACAVYPDLRWELTLTLGSLPSMPEGLICEENILRLSRVPWFRKGSIPDTVRARLVATLEPTRADQIREALVRLLEVNRPPADTFAFNTHALELALNRWMLRKDRKSLNALRKALKRLPPRQVSRNEVTTNLLKAVPHSFFGRRLPGMLYRRGIPAFGLSALVYATFSLILVGATLVALRARSEDVPRWAYARLIRATPAPATNPTPEADSTPLLDATTTPPNANTGSNITATANTNVNVNVNRQANSNRRATPTPTPTPMPAGLSMTVKDIVVADTPDDTVQVFIRLSVTNNGPPTNADGFSLHISGVSSESFEFNDLPIDIDKPYTLSRAGSVIIQSDDDLQLKAVQSIPTGATVSGWLMYHMPRVRLSPRHVALGAEFIRSSALRYVISLTDATGRDYQAAYETR